MGIDIINKELSSTWGIPDFFFLVYHLIPYTEKILLKNVS